MRVERQSISPPTPGRRGSSPLPLAVPEVSAASGKFTDFVHFLPSTAAMIASISDCSIFCTRFFAASAFSPSAAFKSEKTRRNSRCIVTSTLCVRLASWLACNCRLDSWIFMIPPRRDWEGNHASSMPAAGSEVEGIDFEMPAQLARCAQLLDRLAPARQEGLQQRPRMRFDEQLAALQV